AIFRPGRTGRVVAWGRSARRGRQPPWISSSSQRASFGAGNRRKRWGWGGARSWRIARSPWRRRQGAQSGGASCAGCPRHETTQLRTTRQAAGDDGVRIWRRRGLRVSGGWPRGEREGRPAGR
ncbi:hypothetical protein T484DRAFT_1917787, partial [Baffinella frigidus]